MVWTSTADRTSRHGQLVGHQNRQIHAIENVPCEPAEDELAQSAMSVSSHDRIPHGGVGADLGSGTDHLSAGGHDPSSAFG